MEKTIAAIATPHGVGGISIIRVSGKDALPIAQKIYHGKKNIMDAPSHTILYGYAKDGEEIIDQCLFSVMKAPHTFTGEDTVEVNCHGGTVPTNRILEALLKSGASLAEPGEFTKRAFLNGKMDLSQAEAVADIISSKTTSSLSVAVHQLGGNLSKKINEIREKLIYLCAQLDAAADFPEEDIEEISDGEYFRSLQEIETELSDLEKTAHMGKILREGVSCAIVGAPNVGKSSIMNRLLGENRAIVTDIAGTTRDVIEEYVNIGGIPVRLADTAGIRDTEDQIEKIGVEKSRNQLEQADFCLYVIDGSRPETDQPELIALLQEKPYIKVVNKCDLLAETVDGVPVSAKTGKGMDDLKEAMRELLVKEAPNPGKEIITNMRHKEACIKALEAVRGAISLYQSGMEKNLSYIYLENAVSSLGEITGMSVSQEIVNQIFHRFCLGK